MIRWYLNQIHVGTPDEVIAEDIGNRAIKAEWGPLSVIGAIGYALEIHHENRKNYDWVMESH